jgi:hypothetical protein
MAFAVLLILAAAALHPSSAGGMTVVDDGDCQPESPKVVDNFLDQEEIEDFLMICSSRVVWDKYFKLGESLQYRGQVPVVPEFFQRLFEAKALTECSQEDPGEYTGDEKRITTKIIHIGSTALHKDFFTATGAVADEPIGIVFLNDNDDATFIHGKHRITPQKGRLVIFHPNVDHQTVVRKGTVSLLGPYHFNPTRGAARVLGDILIPVDTPPPTPIPTVSPTPIPTSIPAVSPTPIPTPIPTLSPTPIASLSPMPIPTPIPTLSPTPSLTSRPTSKGKGGSTKAKKTPTKLKKPTKAPLKAGKAKGGSKTLVLV